MEPNFFERRRTQLGRSRTEIAAQLKLTAEAIRLWEKEVQGPKAHISALAVAYDVSEKVMEREVMALRRRIEARQLETARS